MQSFRDFIDEIQELSEEDLQELLVPTKGRPSPKIAHKDIQRLWSKFIKDIDRLGYIIPRGHSADKITLHKQGFSPNDIGGNFTLDLPKAFTKL